MRRLPPGRRTVLGGFVALLTVGEARAATPRRRRRPAPPPEEDPAPDPLPADPAPAPASHELDASHPTYDPAPMPNQDAAGPMAPADQSTSVGPTLFHNEQQFRGNAFSRGDSVQNSQDRANKPGVGFSVHVPQ